MASHMKSLKTQQGISLFVALVVLVAMSMVGIVVSRNIDAAVGITGNLAFRQSTLQGTDKALADAISWIENNRTGTAFNSTDAASGYVALTPADEPDWMTDAAWANAFNNGTDAVGNQLRYVIERVCVPGSNGKQYSDTACLLGEPPTAGSVGNSIAAGSYQFEPPPALTFRITARAVGPKKTTSIAQSYYLVPM